MPRRVLGSAWRSLVGLQPQLDPDWSAMRTQGGCPGAGLCVCVCVCVCVMRGTSLSSSSSTICSLIFPTYPLPTKTSPPGQNPGSPRPPLLLDPVEVHFSRKPTLPTQHTDPPPPATRAQSPQSPSVTETQNLAELIFIPTECFILKYDLLKIKTFAWYPEPGRRP